MFDNPIETISFFDSMIGLLRKECKHGWTINTDLTQIENVTTDSIMYLIALMRNIRVLCGGVLFRGNYPKDPKMKSLFGKVGFYRYIRSSVSDFQPDSRFIQIKSGESVNLKEASKICDFAKSAGIIDVKCKKIYTILAELMQNTCNYAYTKEDVFEHNWYVYAEDSGDTVKFVFLDTGNGIPTTVRKNFIEILSRMIFPINEDSKLILSALEGAFRTQTKEEHRGKGLPQIYDYYKIGFIENLKIISGKGYCVFNENTYAKNRIFDLSSEFQGSLFSWDVRKERVSKCV